MATGVLSPADPGYINPKTGILNAATPDKSVLGYDPAQAQSKDMTAATYQANPFTVTTDQTVQGQLDKIISADSKLMQQAQTRANQAAQAKGVLNSSLAIEAGQNAVISQALPIAQQDASTYFNANTNTVNAQNAANYQNMQAENAARAQNAQLGTNVNLANQSATNTAAGFGAEQANRLQLAQLDSNTRLVLSQMDNQYRQLLQQNQSMGAMFNQVLTDITNISTSKDMPRAAKDRAIQTQLNFLREALAAGQEIATIDAGNLQSLDLSPYFNQTGSQIVEKGAAPASSKYEWRLPSGQTSNNIAEVWSTWTKNGTSGSAEAFIDNNRAALNALHIPLSPQAIKQYVAQQNTQGTYL